MGIHEDARQGTLDKEKLAKYLAGNASILEEKDPAQGLTPLAAAAVAGYADVVDLLLKRGAKADALSRDGETPLLLTARDGARNRARIVQLLLAKTPAGSVDATSARDKNNTPLMYAVLKKDLETVRQLCKAGASLTATNDDGLTAKDMAGGDRDVVRAFNIGENRFALPALGALVGDCGACQPQTIWYRHGHLMAMPIPSGNAMASGLPTGDALAGLEIPGHLMVA